MLSSEEESLSEFKLETEVALRAVLPLLEAISEDTNAARTSSGNDVHASNTELGKVADTFFVLETSSLKKETQFVKTCLLVPTRHVLCLAKAQKMRSTMTHQTDKT